MTVSFSWPSHVTLPVPPLTQKYIWFVLWLPASDSLENLAKCCGGRGVDSVKFLIDRAHLHLGRSKQMMVARS